MAERSSELDQGREAFARSAWLAAYEGLSAADATAPLAPADLERLGRAAYMIARDDDYVGAFEHAHRAYLDAGDRRAAVLCGFWIGHNLLFRGEGGRAAGWFARAQRMLEGELADCAERGYVLQARMLEHEFLGDFDGAARWPGKSSTSASGSRTGISSPSVR